ncbi:MAG TPA: hypothetical protein PKX55_15140 [Leptospiraceae bacterium]|nr:hypothetical protein [Leptospiraceae bacterium]
MQESLLPETIDKNIKSSKKNWIQILVFVLSLFLFDQIFFGFFIWNLPNESPWGTNHFFNFIYEKKRIEKTQKVNQRILIIGSSIAYYSLDKDSIREYLHKKLNKDFEIEYLSYAGMTPLDSYLFRNQIELLKPDLIVYPINFIDWRLHRAYVLNPNGSNETADDRSLILDALNFGDAPQSKFAFPMEAILEFHSLLSLDRIADYLSSSTFLFYRYREIFSQNLRNIYNHRFGRNISYHGYAGVQIPERVNSLGWTGRNFSFYPKEYMFERGFLIQIVPEILEKGPLILTLSSQGLEEKYSFQDTGWKKVVLPFKFQSKENKITASLSNVWYPFQAKEDRFDHSRDEVGVRLQQTFGLDRPLSGMQYKREERIEDLRYISMSDEEYKEYFEYRLLSDFEHRPGIRYIHALKNAKERLASEKFRPGIHMQYLQKFLESMKQKKIPILLINNPENPLALRWYEDSQWYKDHLDYLVNLSSENEIFFFDLKHSLKMQDFSDFHHITFPGMEKMNFIYGDLIAELFKEK